MAPKDAADKLNKSLEDLIAEQRSKNKPKPKAGQKVGKGKGKVAIKQQAGKKGVPVRAPLKVQKGGVAKAAGAGKVRCTRAGKPDAAQTVFAVAPVA